MKNKPTEMSSEEKKEVPIVLVDVLKELPVPGGWEGVFKDCQKEIAVISDLIENDGQRREIYPAVTDVFKIFNILRPEDISVVIIGQDPYHSPLKGYGGPGIADGIAFSVSDSVTRPPSLVNIIEEVKKCGYNKLNNNLEGWVKQGVFLLNTALTVSRGIPESHLEYWHIFTLRVIKEINNCKNVVWLLWGGHAQDYERYISRDHPRLKTSHPSPLSAYRGFNGCGHFSQANTLLEKLGKRPIDWSR
jgi:uracil-DNA glycosylase